MFLFLFTFFISSARAERPFLPEPAGVPERFTKLLNSLKDSKSNIDFHIPGFITELGPNFTAAYSSESRQGMKRVLLYGTNAETIFDIGEGNELEAATHTNSPEGVVPYSILFKEGTHPVIRSRPVECITCHTEDFTYIYRQYNKWPDFLGADDDGEHSQSPRYMEIRQHPRFNPFFEGIAEPGKPKEKRRAAFPYYHSEHTNVRKLAHMPNTLFTLSIARRAALSNIQRAKGKTPERFDRVKHALLWYLACYTPEGGFYAPNEVFTLFQNIFRKEVPNKAEKWDRILTDAKAKSKFLNHYQVLSIFDYLGVPPHGHILTRPWNDREEMASLDSYVEFMKEQEYTVVMYPVGGEGIGSPLSFNSGQGKFWEFLAEALDREVKYFPDNMKIKDVRLSHPGEPTPADQLYLYEDLDPEPFNSLLGRLAINDAKGPYCDSLEKRAINELKSPEKDASVSVESVPKLEPSH